MSNAEFKCINDDLNNSERDNDNLCVLWNETLTYLESYAVTLTTSINKSCYHSDVSVVETKSSDSGLKKKQCIMENIDMQKLVKHIYTIILNKDKAYQCFSAQKYNKELYVPSKELENISSVAKWLNRESLEDYFKNHTEGKIKENGILFSRNFKKMITGNSIQMPKSFPIDISANSLPNLWASVGWIPMYSGNDKRSIDTGSERFRAGYAYGEIMGHWGLLQIDKINNESVGAEIGMTIQAMNTFYPYHFHNIPEIYYTIKQPRCRNQIKQFIVDKNNVVLKEIENTEHYRALEFNGADTNDIDHYWISTAPNKDPLIYIPRNSIHAFDLTATYENTSESDVHITIWARSTSNEKKNDYGTTLLCELKNKNLPSNKINSKTANVICKQNYHIY